MNMFNAVAKFREEKFGGMLFRGMLGNHNVPQITTRSVFASFIGGLQHLVWRRVGNARLFNIVVCGYNLMFESRGGRGQVVA